MQNKNNKIYAFIDSQNLNLAIRDCGWELDFARAELVLHAMIEYKNYDKSIIVSGDGDFHCLIEYLKNNNKLLSVIIPNPRKFSALLRKFREDFIYIDRLNKKLGKN